MKIKKHWNGTSHEVNSKIDDFVAEIAKISKRHGMSISHEDGHGCFVIEDFKQSNIEWLEEASDNTKGCKS